MPVPRSPATSCSSAPAPSRLEAGGRRSWWHSDPVSAPSGNTCRLPARDHAAPGSTLALEQGLSSLRCGRVRPLAWCSQPRNSTASPEGALAGFHGDNAAVLPADVAGEVRVAGADLVRERRLDRSARQRLAREADERRVAGELPAIAVRVTEQPAGIEMRRRRLPVRRDAVDRRPG